MFKPTEQDFLMLYLSKQKILYPQIGKWFNMSRQMARKRCTETERYLLRELRKLKEFSND